MLRGSAGQRSLNALEEKTTSMMFSFRLLTLREESRPENTSKTQRKGPQRRTERHPYTGQLRKLFAGKKNSSEM
jgi:hypothetical protein